jgi:type IV pilus assembly protein PilM
MVRLIEMPAVQGKELRSALRYEIGELLPIPVEQAVYDFAVLGPGRPTGDGGETTQVLVAVAQKDIVRDQIAAVTRAGLRVRAVDASSLALLRAVPSPESASALDAVVSLGAQLVVVAVRQGGVPRFMRTATVAVEAETPAKAGAVARTGGVQGRDVPDSRGGTLKVDPVVEEVRSSIDYFLSHAQGEQLARVQLTGGAARRAGLPERLSSALGIPVVVATLDLSQDPSALGLDEAQLEEARWRWTTAAGLALWGTDPEVHSPSLVPPEVVERARRRLVVGGATAGVVVVAGVLGALSHARVDAIRSAKAETAADKREAAVLQAEIFKLQSLAAVQSEVQARRQLAAEALAGDVDWVSLDHRIVRALPRGVKMVDISFSSSPAPVSGPVPATYVGQVTISAESSSGLPSVARFVQAMSKVPGLGAVWVASANGASGQTAGGAGAGQQGSSTMQFSASAEVTRAALSNRAAALPGGTK